MGFMPAAQISTTLHPRHRPDTLPRTCSFNKMMQRINGAPPLYLQVSDAVSQAPRRRLLHPAGGLAVRNVASQQTGAPPATETSRRSGNYHPSIWSHSLIIESMRSTYSETRFLVRVGELKAEARLLLRRCQTPLALLRTIDSMERLGVAYHFQEEIKRALDHYYESCYSSAGSCEEVALGFRLLRQHGHRVSSERLHCGFKDLTIDPKNISSQEIRCLLELYEASHLATCGESNVGEIKDPVSTHLQSLVGRVEGDLAQQVQHSLEMPFHWMMPRLEAQRYIDVYARKVDRDPVLFELAKLDFNMVQAVHQRELRELSRWWTGLGLIESLPFSRDRLVENYLWAMGIAFEPQFSNVRVWLTKLVCILTVIDDIYDVYGTFDELELFTNVVER
ncbi:hypothetical protein Taro_057016 [Colocasia esculenta]|uniref:Uncharacterized protein n=1 Tax=Colocasia esculenta TaxID=4460 RepID=A0A843XXC6_COLES|nr:hypothetical protein [Colocasia esculenta]